MLLFFPTTKDANLRLLKPRFCFEEPTSILPPKKKLVGRLVGYYFPQNERISRKKHDGLEGYIYIDLLGQWLTFQTFGDSIFSRENKVQTFFFRVHWLSECIYIPGTQMTFIFEDLPSPKLEGQVIKTEVIWVRGLYIYSCCLNGPFLVDMLIFWGAT